MSSGRAERDPIASPHRPEIGGNLSSLLEDLAALSSKYGRLIREASGGFLTSNDEGYRDIAPGVTESMTDKRGGLAVFIGAGGLLSILPELPVDAAVMIDRNSALLEFNKLLTELIIDSQDPHEVFARLYSKDVIDNNPVITEVMQKHGDLALPISFILGEQAVYGEHHWTRASRFELVKRSLKDKPLVAIEADLTDPYFNHDFSSTLKQHGLTIPFANFTNIHEWIKLPMDFVRTWPFDDQPVILYSRYKGCGVHEWPKMNLARSVNEYVFQAE